MISDFEAQLRSLEIKANYLASEINQVKLMLANLIQQINALYSKTS